MKQSSILIAFTLAAPISLATRVACAQDNPAPGRADAGAERDQVSSGDTRDNAPARRTWAVEANPLGLGIGRYSLQAEFLPAPHHALVVNPHFDHVNANVSTNGATDYTETFSGFGGELGYRFYTGERGPNGFFVGPSFLLGFYDAKANAGAASTSKSFRSVGAALDVGGQHVFDSGFVLGGGFGLQTTSTNLDKGNTDLPVAAAIVGGGGVRPRFLLTVGWAG